MSQGYVLFGKGKNFMKNTAKTKIFPWCFHPHPARKESKISRDLFQTLFKSLN